MTSPLLLSLAEARDPALVGGKAVNLAELIRADLPVPDGFVVTTAGYRAGLTAGAMPAGLAEKILGAYRRMDSPLVAVRSSATAEDLAGASMAGQYDTFLNIHGDQDLLDAVSRCWASLDSPRTRAYLREQRIDLAEVAMAVVVQRQVAADVAGVLFTVNPRTGQRGEMLVEGSWGLGEAVVSGMVQPDVARLDGATGRTIEYRAADKHVCLRPGDHQPQPVAQDMRRQRCLTDADLSKLWSLGRRAADHFGAAQDVEWAMVAGEPFMLQARPITALDDAGMFASLVRQERQRLDGLLAAGRGPWARHNIGETLPHPTPLTWSVIRRFMSGAGGFGEMYRLAGFQPSEKVRRDGFLERIAGKLYMDLSLAGEMFLADYPFAYDLDLLRRSPDAGQSPPTRPAGPLRVRLRAGRRAAQANEQVRRLAGDLDRRLTEEVIPELVSWCRREKDRDLASLDGQAWLDLWRRRETRVFDEFAPPALLASLVEGAIVADLRAFLDEHFWDDDPDELVRLLSASQDPDMTVRSNIDLYEIAGGRRSTEQWLADHGHRAAGEFDLATPRWRERVGELAAMAARLTDGADPAEIHRRRLAEAKEHLARLEAQLGPKDRKELHRLVSLLRRYLRFREDGKYYLMLGYDLLRDLALDAGRRLGVGEDVFLLTHAELREALLSGSCPGDVIAERRRLRRAEGRIALPAVIDAETLTTLGEAPDITGKGRVAALAVSSGSASGPARIVLSPASAGELGQGYVLVCPSTDPSWTPLFVNAAAIVLERGGMLSHGAVVAREMGIPAVVVESATRLLTDGQTVTVDGTVGTLYRQADADEQAEGPDPDNVRIGREMVPPPPGARERAGGKIFAVAALAWSAYLLAAWLGPEAWLRKPTFDLLDMLIWPAIRTFGKPAAVAIVAAAFAALILTGQRLLTDTARLRQAKRRASLLTKAARELPAGCPRRKTMESLAAPVTGRILLASLVPIAAILGPMMMTFLWFPQRVAPATWNAAPGSAVTVIAEVDGDRPLPVTLEVSEGLVIDEATPAVQTSPAIRETLQRLLARIDENPDVSGLPWKVGEAMAKSPKESTASLRAYLAAGVPPQGMIWKVHPPANVAGRFRVTVSAPGERPLSLAVILGDRHPPRPQDVPAAPGSALVSVSVSYAKPAQPRIFWAPLQALGWSDWDAGWLITYLLAYLPVMFILKRLLSLP